MSVEGAVECSQKCGMWITWNVNHVGHNGNMIPINVYDSGDGINVKGKDHICPYRKSSDYQPDKYRAPDVTKINSMTRCRCGAQYANFVHGEAKNCPACWKEIDGRLVCVYTEKGLSDREVIMWAIDSGKEIPDYLLSTDELRKYYNIVNAFRLIFDR